MKTGELSGCLIKAMGVGFTYPTGDPVLSGVNFTLEPGSVVAIAGPNGAGKTTLALLLNGILLPTRGKIVVGERDTALVPASIIAARVGYVFQNPRSQVFAPTVAEEVAFGPGNLGMSEAEVARVTSEALIEMGLEDSRDLHPYDLNHAELRRLAMASVLAMHTEVVIFDEPTRALDRLDYERFLRVIARLRGEGRTIVVVTHDLDFVGNCCERILVLKNGQVVADGTPRDVFAANMIPELQRPAAMRLADALGLGDDICSESGLVEAWRAQGRSLPQ